MTNTTTSAASVAPVVGLPATIIVRKSHQGLRDLENAGCSIMYNEEMCPFKTNNPFSLPAEFHLIPLPADWDCDNHHWAPPGFRSLGLEALISVGIEHPDLQKMAMITATSAVVDDSPVNFPVYAYLGMLKGKRILSIDGSMYVPFCIRGKLGDPSVVGIFIKV